MEKYKKYKNSGIDWLGEIPEHWEVGRVKDIGNVVLGKMLNNKPQNGYLLKPYLKSKNINWLKTNLKSVEKMYFNTNELIRYKIKKDDLLLSEGGEVGKTSIWNEEILECYIQNSVHKITINKKNNPYYYLYMSFNLGHSEYYNSIVNQVSIRHLTYEKLQKIYWLIPPLKEQTEIANYLDAKTQTIDKKVKLLSEKISTYKDYRKTLINQTVTKGLDKNVKLKNSGINWIGEIPKHWEVKRFKSFGKTIKGKNMEMSDLKFDNSLPLLSLEYLRNDSVQHPTFCYSNDKSLKSTNEDLIIVWDGAAVGEIIKSKVGYVSSTIAKLEINKKKFNTRYFYHLRGAIDYKLKQIPTGMGIPHLNPTLFKNFKCPTPPLKEQQAIANYLDDKTQTIDTIIKNIENQITTLKELRKTLINEVVTGNVKITE
ncbi:restriction endonuclease subunit S [Tenacibaculum finnmarkense]|uniref:restriction endonuclease subunit S n=1 Tax=Tenacibaculum finnmarkense TaxID=2781243 RepID=UPI001EFB0441|nr:restriction endonuclease subunit S [Tenacibaculum finnmarkense]MCG8754757.1 restriction endonuclease subunit S [Tenacibaculum finnmarkense]MCG8782937.1 restriction endonuclease subunit S [Tenacibaculum finnmarkense]